MVKLMLNTLACMSGSPVQFAEVMPLVTSSDLGLYSIAANSQVYVDAIPILSLNGIPGDADNLKHPGVSLLFSVSDSYSARTNMYWLITPLNMWTCGEAASWGPSANTTSSQQNIVMSDDITTGPEFLS